MLFDDLSEIKCFEVTKFHDEDVDYLGNIIPEDWFATRNIHNDKALARKSWFI